MITTGSETPRLANLLRF